MRSTTTRPDHRLPSHSRQRGWTRFQLFAAIGVIAIIAIVAAPRLNEAFHHAHNAEIVAAEHDLADISKALQRYKHDTGHYPSTEQGLLALVIKPTRAPVPRGWKTGGYIDRLPRDPWGNAYQYRLAEDYKDFELFSFGANGPDDGNDSPGVIRAGQH